MPSQRSGGGGLSFFGMVGGVMALLKLKDKYDQYKQTAGDDEEGRVALVSPSVEHLEGTSPGIALLDTEIPASMRRSKPKKSCCMCCGMDCSLFWKAVGIVLFGWMLYMGFKAVKWAMTDAPTGLEGMPQFSTSLGCLNAPHIYNSSEVHLSIPIATRSHSSSFNIRGGSVGTIIIADGDADATEIKYEITIRAAQEELLKKLNFVYPDANEDGSITRSRLIIDTPSVPEADETQCMRYDIKMYLPPNLKMMHVQAHAAAHVQFAPGTRGGASMEQLRVTLFAPNPMNLLVPSADVAVKNLQLEVYRGWLVGEAQIVDNLSIETQRWDAVANVKIVPAPPADPANPNKAMLQTATGAGRADFVYLGSKAFTRPIQAMHTSSKNADMYLTYRGSGFNGKIAVDTKSYTITGAQRFGPSTMRRDDDDSTPSKWTHFYGDPDGGDEITITSGGWVGLYL